MNKKFLSAILFGALMVTSTGTFVSCKDYDDDIDDLQTQIDGLESTLDALQTKVNEGKWITNLSSTTNGFTVVFSDGSSYTIENGEDGAKGDTGAAGKDGTIITVEDGFWCLDGEKSDYVAVTEDDITGAVFVPEVGEDGYWYFYNEDTKAMEKSEYKAVGAAYAVYANGKYTLYMPDADGNMLSGIELPTAASMITAVTFTNADALELSVYKSTWQFAASANIASASAWNGTKTLPADGAAIYGANDIVEIQINPADIDVVKEGVKFTLVNSKNETTLAQLALTAESFDGYIKADGTRTRAVANGLYDITMEPQTIAASKVEAIDEALDAAKDGAIGYALNAGDGCRSAYSITLAEETNAPQLSTLTLNGTEATIGASSATTVDGITVGTPYEVTFDKEAAVYDAYFTVAGQYKDAFGIVIDNEKRTITVGKNPDSSTIGTSFPMTVYTADITGQIKETTLTINLSSIISGVQTLSAQTVNVATNDKFSFALSDMTVNSSTAWMLNVDLSETEYALYEDAACKQEVSGDIFSDDDNDYLFTAETVAALTSTSATTDVNSAKYVRFTIDNDEAADAGLSLNTTYYVKVTFNDGESNELNSVVLPVKFTAPALSTMFEKKSGFVANDGTINAYFYDLTGKKAVALNYYFSKSVDDATVALDNTTKVGSTDKTSLDLANLADATFGSSNLSFNAAAGNKSNTQFELGYGEALTVKVSKNNYEGWKYTEDAEKTYTFKMRIMSSIVEGSVKATGNVIELNANDATTGAFITDSMIKGYDYNNNSYNVVPDAVNEEDADEPDWKNVYVEKVTATPDADGYILNVETVPASNTNSGIVNGSFKVTAASLSQTVTVKMPVQVEDIWGYKLDTTVDVRIKVGE